MFILLPLIFLILLIYASIKIISSVGKKYPAAVPEGLSGVGGWLTFQIGGLIAWGPVFGFLLSFSSFSNAERDHPGMAEYAPWQNFKMMFWLQLLVLIGWGIYSGYRLLVKRTPSVVDAAKLYYKCAPLFAIATIFMSYIAFGQLTGEVVGQSIGTIFSSVISSLIWIAYFNRSVRVRNTYGYRLKEQEQTSSSEKIEV